MFVVAIQELATPVEDEAKALAADLGSTVYETKLALAVPPPTVVLTTADRARAAAVLGAIRARGHGAVACDVAAVASSATMTRMRHFAIEEDAIVLDAGARLPFADVSVICAAQHRVQIDTSTEHTEKKFDVTRAVISGGLVMRKAVTTTSHATSSDSQRVLYVFRASGEPPWMLREREANYAALARVAPTARENFDAMTALLRARAPHAAYDARLLQPRRVPETLRVAGDARNKTTTSSMASGIDLLAHLVAMWLSKR